MKSCTSLWIVAPITRAVDDKTAKSLLGDSFRRQLKYDGIYSAVSFICSKTDDISITEAIDSLNLEDETSESWTKAETLESSIESAQLDLKELEEQKAEYGEQLDEIEAKADAWDALKTQAEHGEIVYSPLDGPKKRKRPTTPFKSLKNREAYDSDMTDDDWDAYENSLTDDSGSQSDTNRQPLTQVAIDEALSSFRAQRMEIRQARQALNSKIGVVYKMIQEAESERSDILAEVKTRCIQGRNEYSRGAIKQDFASGIKE